MLDIARFKQVLVESGGLAKAQIERAQQHAMEQGVSLSEALVVLNIAGYGKLGQCLSEICDLPYIRLQGQPLSPEARSMIPDVLAIQWKTIPVDFNPQENILTLAIADRDQILKIEKMFRFLLQPVALGYVIVSQPELDKLFSTHYGIYRKKSATTAKSAVPIAASAPHEKKALKALHETTSPAESTDPPADALAAPTHDAPGPGGRRLSRYSPLAARAALARATREETAAGADKCEIGRTLLNSVELLVQTRIGEQSEKAAQTADRARYCRMMAVRLNLSPFQSDVLELAVWLSALDNGRQVARQLALPCDMDMVLQHGEVRPDSPPERKILSLVELYQSMRENDAAAARDVNLVRSRLRAHWSSDPEEAPMLETFLQVLMDDAFLSDAHSPLPETESGVKGSLADMSFADMIQILCAGGKNMDIALSRNGEKALVCIRDGEVAHASLAELTGNEAFYRIAQWCDGDFVARPQSDIPIRTIHLSLMSLLMERARLADEQAEKSASEAVV